MLFWPISTFKPAHFDLQQSKIKVTCSFKFDGGSTAPSKIGPTWLMMPKSTGVDLMGSTPRSKRRICSLVIVFWKETAFPCWRTMDSRCNRNVVSLGSWVMTVMRRPIFCPSVRYSCCLNGNGTEDVSVLAKMAYFW